jgi:hypothetical protein
MDDSIASLIQLPLEPLTILLHIMALDERIRKHTSPAQSSDPTPCKYSLVQQPCTSPAIHQELRTQFSITGSEPVEDRDKSS